MKNLTYITPGATKFVVKGPLIAYFDDKVNLEIFEYDWVKGNLIVPENSSTG